MILATFVFADGTSRQSDVDEPPPTELVMEEIPAPGFAAMRAWVAADVLAAGATRRTFALEEGGPPYRYREVMVAAPSREGV